jgi:hypothetical protein
MKNKIPPKKVPKNETPSTQMQFYVCWYIIYKTMDCETIGILQQGHYNKDITTRTLQQGHYNKDLTTRTLQQGHYNKDITTRTLQQGQYNKDITTRVVMSL